MKLNDGREVDEALYRERFTEVVSREPPRYAVRPCRFCLRPAIADECYTCGNALYRLRIFLGDGGPAARALIAQLLEESHAQDRAP